MRLAALLLLVAASGWAGAPGPGSLHGLPAGLGAEGSEASETSEETAAEGSKASTTPAEAFSEASSGADVRALALGDLARLYPEASARMDVRVQALRPSPPASALPAGGLALVWPAATGLPRGLVRVGVDARGARAGYALLYVAHYDSAAVARRPLRRGEALGADGVEGAWVETTRRGTPLLSPEEARTFGPEATLRRAVRAGEGLRPSDLARPPAVGLGEAVEVRYERAGLILVLTAHAREAGEIGQTIRVHSRPTGATYRVRLTARGQADWLETL